MNNTDRKYLQQIYTCLTAVGDLGPSNPADIKRVVQTRRIATSVSKDVAAAIFDLSIGDYEEAGTFIDDAFYTLNEDRSQRGQELLEHKPNFPE